MLALALRLSCLVLFLHPKVPILVSGTLSNRFHGTINTPPAYIPTPLMGWNSWNAFGCMKSQLTQTSLEEIADNLISTGLASAGYIYVNLDDCWMDPSMLLDPNNGLLQRVGALRADPARFKNGSLASLSEYLHSRGLRLGVYLDVANLTCGGDPGSLGFEEQDVQTLSDWQVDYLKLDSCFMGRNSQPQELYATWSRLLQSVKERFVVFSCSYPAYNTSPQYPDHFDWETTRNTCNLWRLFHDILPRWTSLKAIIDFWGDHQDTLAPLVKVNSYNDPDFLIVGQSDVTTAEAQTQMSLWAIFAAPLLISTDLRIMTDDALAVLTNTGVVEINQNSFVSQGTRVLNSDVTSTWVRKLSNDSLAVAVTNHKDYAQQLVVSWNDIVAGAPEMLSIDSVLKPACFVIIRDLWLRADRELVPAIAPVLESPTFVSGHGTFFTRLTFSKCCLAEKNSSSQLIYE